jgi:S-adenosylmethionine synthetase
MGRAPQTKVKHFDTMCGDKKSVEVDLFTWEKLDFVDRLKQEFGL